LVLGRLSHGHPFGWDFGDAIAKAARAGVLQFCMAVMRQAQLAAPRPARAGALACLIEVTIRDPIADRGRSCVASSPPTSRPRAQLSKPTVSRPTPAPPTSPRRAANPMSPDQRSAMSFRSSVHRLLGRQDLGRSASITECENSLSRTASMNWCSASTHAEPADFRITKC